MRYQSMQKILFIFTAFVAQNITAGPELYAQANTQPTSHVVRELACRHLLDNLVPRIEAQHAEFLNCAETDRASALRASQFAGRYFGRQLSHAETLRLLEALGNAWIESHRELAPVEPANRNQSLYIEGLLAEAQNRYRAREREILQEWFPTVRNFRDGFFNRANYDPNSQEIAMGRGLAPKARLTFAANVELRYPSLWDQLPSWMPGATANEPFEIARPLANTSRLWTQTAWYYASLEEHFADFDFTRNADVPLAEHLEIQTLASRQSGVGEVFSVCLLSTSSGTPEGGAAPCVFVHMRRVYRFLVGEAARIEFALETGAISFRNFLDECKVQPTAKALLMPLPRPTVSVAPLTANQMVNRAVFLTFMSQETARNSTTLSELQASFAVSQDDARVARLCLQSL